MLRDLVKAYQTQNNLSVRALAAEIGICHTVLFRWMNGHELLTPHWVTILKWVLLSEGQTTKKEKHGKETR